MSDEIINPITPTQEPIAVSYDSQIPPINIPLLPKKFPLLVTFLLILLVLFAVLGIYLLIQIRSLNIQINTPPSPLPTPVASVDPTLSWQVITNNGLLYTLKLPTDWKTIEHSSNFNEDYESYESASGQRIDIVKDNNPRTVCRGDCPALESSTEVMLGKYSTTKDQGYIGDIGGNIAHRYITYNIPNGKTSLDITFHPSTIDKESGGEIVPITSEEAIMFDEILSTFKFVNSTQTPTSFSCPKTEWVDCMPTPDVGVRLECTSEYMSWATANCPGFKGGAL